MKITAIDPAAATTTASAAQAPDARVMKAARDFEAMAIGQMLEPMFATVDTAQGPFGGGAGEESFKPMLVTEMAKQVEDHGGLGLADSIYQQMLKIQEKHG
ncbi:MAG: rod-binding protein [Janthinobacterium lividum]